MYQVQFRKEKFMHHYEIQVVGPKELIFGEPLFGAELLEERVTQMCVVT